jgi:hypothetical protein
MYVLVHKNIKNKETKEPLKEKYNIYNYLN